MLWLGLRRAPSRWPGTLPGQGQARTPWWAVAGVLAVAAGFAVWQITYHSQQVLVQLDPGSYMQFGYWIAHHGSLPIPQSRAAFGGTHGVLHFASAAFYPKLTNKTTSYAFKWLWSSPIDVVALFVQFYQPELAALKPVLPAAFDCWAWTVYVLQSFKAGAAATDQAPLPAVAVSDSTRAPAVLIPA